MFLLTCLKEFDRAVFRFAVVVLDLVMKDSKDEAIKQLILDAKNIDNLPKDRRKQIIRDVEKTTELLDELGKTKHA